MKICNGGIKRIRPEPIRYPLPVVWSLYALSFGSGFFRSWLYVFGLGLNTCRANEKCGNKQEEFHTIFSQALTEKGISPEELDQPNKLPQLLTKNKRINYLPGDMNRT